MIVAGEVKEAERRRCAERAALFEGLAGLFAGGDRFLADQYRLRAQMQRNRMRAQRRGDGLTLVTRLELAGGRVRCVPIARPALAGGVVVWEARERVRGRG